MDGHATHQRLLVKYLMGTTGAVLELGVGEYSTPLIHEIATSQGRRVVTVDLACLQVAEFEQFASPLHDFHLVGSWDDWQPSERFGLAFIDHGPCERRVIDIRRLLPRVDLFVMHDSEDSAYGFDGIRRIMDHVETDSTRTPWTSVFQSRLPLFPVLELETCSMCNRACPTCIRNSHPDRGAIAPWFQDSRLPEDVIRECAAQAASMGFKGGVCLSHYNEPLLDERLPEIAMLIKRTLPRSEVYCYSNGEALTEDMAAELDGVMDRITWTLYSDSRGQTEARRRWIASLFRQTWCEFIGSEHVVTHFSPHASPGHSGECRALACAEPIRRMILNHRGDMLMCCDDVVGNFDLGRFPDASLADLWWSDRHQSLVRGLSVHGGRTIHTYCLSCPRN